MKTLSRFFDWLGESVVNAERQRREAYRAQATDLEFRIREFERQATGVLRGW